MQGIAHLHAVLREKASRITQAALWRIPHHSQTEDVRLKIGCYEKKVFELGNPETEKPKSELALDNEELKILLVFGGKLRTVPSGYLTVCSDWLAVQPPEYATPSRFLRQQGYTENTGVYCTPEKNGCLTARGICAILV